jgi:hypothetical protein
VTVADASMTDAPSAVEPALPPTVSTSASFAPLQPPHLTVVPTAEPGIAPVRVQPILVTGSGHGTRSASRATHAGPSSPTVSFAASPRSAAPALPSASTPAATPAASPTASAHPSRKATYSYGTSLMTASHPVEAAALTKEEVLTPSFRILPEVAAANAAAAATAATSPASQATGRKGRGGNRSSAASSAEFISSTASIGLAILDARATSSSSQSSESDDIPDEDMSDGVYYVRHYSAEWRERIHYQNVFQQRLDLKRNTQYRINQQQQRQQQLLQKQQQQQQQPSSTPAASTSPASDATESNPHDNADSYCGSRHSDHDSEHFNALPSPDALGAPSFSGGFDLMRDQDNQGHGHDQDDALRDPHPGSAQAPTTPLVRVRSSDSVYSMDSDAQVSRSRSLDHEDGISRHSQSPPGSPSQAASELAGNPTMPASLSLDASRDASPDPCSATSPSAGASAASLKPSASSVVPPPTLPPWLGRPVVFNYPLTVPWRQPRNLWIRQVDENYRPEDDLVVIHPEPVTHTLVSLVPFQAPLSRSRASSNHGAMSPSNSSAMSPMSASLKRKEPDTASSPYVFSAPPPSFASPHGHGAMNFPC